MPQTSRKDSALTITRKRSETSTDGDGDERAGKKRSRGRPRLDTKDETAADRRRTQIRLAQRAYRNRKDTAIDTLKLKVKELEQVNEDIGREFMSFSDFVLQQGMLHGSPEIAKRLNDATRKILSYTRKTVEDTSTDGDGDGDGDVDADIDANTNVDADADADADTSFNPADPPRRPQRTAEKSSSTSTSSEVHSTPNTDWGSEETGLHTVPELPDHFQQHNPLAQMPVNYITQPSVKDASFPVFNNEAHISLFTNPFAQSPCLSLPAPGSHASQERTFGRRLQRATVEAGLRLAMMQDPPPERYMGVFSFCLQFENRQDIIRRLSCVLQCTDQETLNNWKFPFTNLGGAGLSYPGGEGNERMLAQDFAGNELPIGNQGLPEPFKPWELTGFSMGPFGREVEFAKDLSVDNRMRMLHPGFEGDFFDADEVEAYLRQRGIVIPPNKDFVDAEIDLTAFQNPPELRPQSMSPGRQGFFAHPLANTTNPDPFPMFSNGVDGAGNMWSGSLPPPTNPVELSAAMNIQLASGIPTAGSANEFNHPLSSFGATPDIHWRAWESETTPSWTKTRVTINVNRLVTELTGMAVCLGRAPAVRPKDLHRAVRMSIILQGQ